MAIKIEAVVSVAINRIKNAHDAANSIAVFSVSESYLSRVKADLDIAIPLLELIVSADATITTATSDNTHVAA